MKDCQNCKNFYTCDNTGHYEECLANDQKDYEERERLITLSDGTSMGDSIIIFETNAPADELKALEQRSCKVYIDGGDSDDVPVWAQILQDKGYMFEYIDEHQHITPYETSNEWLEKYHSEIQEHYVIENQPE